MTAAPILVAMLLAASPTVKPVSGDLVCKVQHALRYRNAPWTPDMCTRVAEAANTTFAPRLVLAIAINESDLREAIFRRARRGVYDVGLMGVRCRVATAGLCINGPARGHTMFDLHDPATNIKVAARILEQKKRRSPKHYLRHYNGGTREHGYAARIRVLEAALAGRRRPIDNPRTRKQARLIIAALQE